MNQKIAEYRENIKNIRMVLDKLVKTVNSSVFDKLCVKCEDVFLNIASNSPQEMSSEERREIIAVLNELLDCCKTLSSYKVYLENAVTATLAQLQNAENNVVREETPEQSLAPTEEKGKELTLRNPNEGKIAA